LFRGAPKNHVIVLPRRRDMPPMATADRRRFKRIRSAGQRWTAVSVKFTIGRGAKTFSRFHCCAAAKTSGVGERALGRTGVQMGAVIHAAKQKSASNRSILVVRRDTGCGKCSKAMDATRGNSKKRSWANFVEAPNDFGWQCPLPSLNSPTPRVFGPVLRPDPWPTGMERGNRVFRKRNPLRAIRRRYSPRAEQRAAPAASATKAPAGNIASIYRA